MDVSALKTATSAAIHIKNAAGEPLYADAEKTKPVRIHVYGPGSVVYGAIESRQTARVLKRMNDNDGKPTAPTSEEALAQQAEDLTDITVSFENLTCGDLTGPALYAAVYGDRELGFITAQVQKFLKDWGNFLPGSSAN